MKVKSHLIVVALSLIVPIRVAAFEPREDERFERGYYVPADLNEALSELDDALSDEEQRAMRGRTRREMVLYQRGLGTWIRNYWLRGADSRLRNFFEAKGVASLEGMSGLILDAYWLHLEGKEVRLGEMIDRWLELRRNAAPPADMTCPDRPASQLEELFFTHTVSAATGHDSWAYFAVCPATGSHWVFENGRWASPTPAQRAEIAEFETTEAPSE